MLTAAVDDLESVGRRRDQYKRCAHLLEAVAQLLEHFSQYQDVPKIASLTKRLAVVQVRWGGAGRGAGGRACAVAACWRGVDGDGGLCAGAPSTVSTQGCSTYRRRLLVCVLLNFLGAADGVYFFSLSVSCLRCFALLQAGLQDSVLDDFKLLLGPSDVQLSPDNTERLSSACLVVSALGPRVRDRLMDWLCEREMAVYQV